MNSHANYYKQILCVFLILSLLTQKSFSASAQLIKPIAQQCLKRVIQLAKEHPFQALNATLLVTAIAAETWFVYNKVHHYAWEEQRIGKALLAAQKRKSELDELVKNCMTDPEVKMNADQEAQRANEISEKILTYGSQIDAVNDTLSKRRAAHAEALRKANAVAPRTFFNFLYTQKGMNPLSATLFLFCANLTLAAIITSTLSVIQMQWHFLVHQMITLDACKAIIRDNLTIAAVYGSIIGTLIPISIINYDWLKYRDNV